MILQRYQLSLMILVSVSIDNVATPIVALLSGYLQHKLGPKVLSTVVVYVVKAVVNLC